MDSLSDIKDPLYNMDKDPAQMEMGCEPSDSHTSEKTAIAALSVYSQSQT